MRNDRPILRALMWTTLGFVAGIAVMLAWNRYRASQGQLSDEALDAQARHQGVR